MKIGAQQFRFPSPALLIALDGQTARVFRAHEGTVAPLASLQVLPKKTDERKPLVRRSGRGHVLATGAPSNEWSVDAMFLPLVRKVNAAVRRELTRGIAEVYLFVPQYLVGEAQQHLEADVRRILKHVFPVDVVHDHPRTLVERITAEFRP